MMVLMPQKGRGANVYHPTAAATTSTAQEMGKTPASSTDASVDGSQSDLGAGEGSDDDEVSIDAAPI